MKPASSAAAMAASSRRMRLGRLGPDGDDRFGGPDRERGDRRALDDRERIVLHQEAIRARRRVGAVAVGDDVPPRGLGGGRGPPFVTGRVAAATQPAEPGRARSWRSSRSARDPGSTVAGPRRRPPGPQRRGPSGPWRAARSSRIVGQLDGVLSSSGHQALRLLPAAGRRATGAAEGSIQGGEERRLRRPMRIDRGDLVGGRGRLEAEVRVVARGAIDHRVPGTGQVADPLERGDRQVAVRGLGRLEDLEHVGRVAIELVEDRVDLAEVDRGERAGRPDPGRSDPTAAAPTPRAARRRSPAAPSGRDTARECPSRPCRCTRSGRPARTGSRSRT